MSRTKAYRGDGITVHFEAARCIHAAECVQGLPGVFDPKARPWIQPTHATTDEVAAVVARCPTGALKTVRDDGRATEPVPTRNELHLVADGPLYLRGDVEWREGPAGDVVHETRMALCRCGASKHKPYCDNSHAGAGFKDDGTPAAAATPPLATGPLKLTLTENGPLQCNGPVALFDAFGEHVASVQETWLCRCGGSSNKPFCDGSHRKIGFRS